MKIIRNLFSLPDRPRDKSQCSSRLGVRGILLDDGGQVFLVRHTFVAGWHLPGGRVKSGESAVMALARELEERGDILLSSAPHLHGLFFNERAREHVACYVIRNFRRLTQPLDPDFGNCQGRVFRPRLLADAAEPNHIGPSRRGLARGPRRGDVVDITSDPASFARQMRQ